MPNAAVALAALVGGAIMITYGAQNTKAALTHAPATSNNAPAAPATTNSGDTYGQVSKADVQRIGAAHGWTQAQIDDWFHNLIPSESNGTLTDTNPSSGAYGIAQGIDGPKWYAAHGGNSNTVTGQLTAMANYIATRYGNPSAAWTFHKAHNWY